MRLTRYGRDEVVCLTVILGAIAAGLYVVAGPWPALAPIPAYVFFLSFFRDPPRQPPDGPEAWVSPADGKVSDIAEVEEGRFIHGPARRLGIFMSPLNVHVNRAPAEGTVRYLGYEPGKFLDARSPDCPERNESQWIGLAAGPGDVPIVVRQIAGIVARRIVCDLREGDRLARGERFGMVKFGSRVEIYVPAAAPIEIVAKVGEKVRAGETVVMRVRAARQDSGCRMQDAGKGTASAPES